MGGRLTLDDEIMEVSNYEPYNMVVFDRDGRIMGRVGTDIPFLKKQSIFEMISDEEKMFFAQYCNDMYFSKLLLETTRGPMLVFCDLYTQTGLFTAILFRTTRETLRDFWKYGFLSDVRVSPYLKEKTLPRKRGIGKDTEMIAQSIGMLTPLLKFDYRSVDQREGSCFLASVASDVCTLARCVGCAVSLRVARRAEFFRSWIFHKSSFIIIMFYLFSVVACYSNEKRVKMDIFEQDGRAFICAETFLKYKRDKITKTHSCEYAELEECMKIAKRHDLFLDIVVDYRKEVARIFVRLSPEFQDDSYLGLNNPMMQSERQSMEIIYHDNED